MSAGDPWEKREAVTAASVMFPKPVRFLHELHHILMDCGIEKEIMM
jgi:hypothetical protein